MERINVSFNEIKQDIGTKFMEYRIQFSNVCQARPGDARSTIFLNGKLGKIILPFLLREFNKIPFFLSFLFPFFFLIYTINSSSCSV